MSETQKGTSWTTRYLLKTLGPEKCQELSLYSQDVLKEEFTEFTSEEQINEMLSDIVKEYIEKLSINEIGDLRFYTGYDYRFINNTMRGKWNYEENGLLTSEKKEYYRNLGESIYQIINKFPSLPMNIKSYRGVSIKAFFDYGITSLEDLVYMEGQYIYESGFSSTSLLRNVSYFGREDLGWHDTCNIEIEYSIPSLCKDGAILLTDVLSYSKSQMEYVINSGSLTKITSVDIDKENNTAKLKAILIPKSLWDPKQLEEKPSVIK